MKARKFGELMNEAAGTAMVVSRDEPTIVVRHGLNGPELAVKAVKVRHDKDAGPLIIIEIPE